MSFAVFKIGLAESKEYVGFNDSTLEMVITLTGNINTVPPSAFEARKPCPCLALCPVPKGLSSLIPLALLNDRQLLHLLDREASYGHDCPICRRGQQASPGLRSCQRNTELRIPSRMEFAKFAKRIKRIQRSCS